MLLAKFIVYQTVLALYSAGVLVFAYRSFVGQVEGFTQLALIGFAVNAAVVVVLFCVGFFPKITGRLLPQLSGDPGPAAHRPGAGARRRRHRPGDHRLPPGLYRAAPGTPGDGGMAVMTTLQLTAFFLVPYCVLRALGSRICR